MEPPLGPRTCRISPPPTPRSPASAETIVGLCGSSTGGGRNKEPGYSRKMWDRFRRQRWIRSRGCRDGRVRWLTHPTRASVWLSSRCGTPDPCSLCLLLRLLLLPLLLLPPPPWEEEKKGGDKRRREMAGLLDQIFNHRSAGWPGCEDEGSRPERAKQRTAAVKKESASIGAQLPGRFHSAFKIRTLIITL